MNIERLSIGKPKELLHSGSSFTSAIAKNEAQEIYAGKTIIQGDEVANKQFHGGEDRVICAYPFEHYAYWEQVLGSPLQHAAFGENLTVSNGKEDAVQIGDIYQAGEAIVELSQGRYPCITINKYNSSPLLLNKIFETGYTGYFFRVIKPGMISRDSKVTLLERKPNSLTPSFIHRIFFHDRSNKEAIRQILALEWLADDWTNKFRKLIS
ncbi:MOSC domain-containing protein [Metabacillus sp. GX 13764]|uniref:MOSC domain-containing protein n=1 Tax=Metabacillus kandeliae TaxID=2900151 RepID=UPI001E60AC30|nr:MOSC domain-containing protein [Metabacillus kandeliae]MCD7035088.1 MOSC domain-containing protein [Metabacillus kandeliae]